jgi:urease accessory protein UreH
LWQERLYAEAADRIFESPLGWAGRPIAASVWCCAPSLAAVRLRDLRDAWRALLEASPDAPAPGQAPSIPGGAGQVRGGASLAADGLLLAKLLADDVEQLMTMCQSLWRAARLALDGDEGSAPRVWRT